MPQAKYFRCSACNRWTLNAATGACENTACPNARSRAAVPLRPKKVRSLNEFKTPSSVLDATKPAWAKPGKSVAPRPKRGATPPVSPGAGDRGRGRHQETFTGRAVRLFKRNVAGSFTRANEWRRRSADWVEEKLDDLYEWEKKNMVGLIVGLAVFIELAFLGWFIVDWLRGRVAGNALQVGVGGLIGGAVTGFIISLVAASLLLLVVLFANPVFKFLAPILLFVPLLLWVPLYALWQAAIVAGKLLLLVPLGLLFVASRLVQLWRGIFYTCPSRQCVYRGLPLYECPHCGAAQRKLWPNLYGAFYHFCVNCDARLPALDWLGRAKLARRCGDCEIPLRGRHAGKARESLIAIAGGPGSGKTNYLLMAVHELTGGGANHDAASLRGEIDEAEQADEFAREWRNLSEGRPAAKTSEVLRAFLLYVTAGRARHQVYLYDAPGEEFATISSMTRQQYLALLKGFVLLVDPLSFEAVRSRVSGTRTQPTSLQDVVTSTLAAATAGVAFGREGKLPMKVAVVISKADMEAVREQLGDARQQRVEGAKCRAAIQKWGGENALRALEHRFEQVEYFCCSPLGRDADARRTDGFKGYGVLEPLRWVLTGQRN